MENEKVYWNPWHGCHKCSPGCLNCYMYEQDRQYGMDSNTVKRTNKFNLPISKNRQRELKYPAGTIFPTCFSSDFFIEEADEWRDEAWDIIQDRSDCLFFIVTKRPERIESCLPYWWDNETPKHVQINVTAENQEMADKRIPQFLDIPMSYHGIAVAPMLEPVTLKSYLQTGKVSFVSVGGESGKNSRPIFFDWVKALQHECEEYEVPFMFHQTGTRLVVGNKIHTIPRELEKEQAKKAGLDTLQKYITRRDVYE